MYKVQTMPMHEVFIKDWVSQVITTLIKIIHDLHYNLNAVIATLCSSSRHNKATQQNVPAGKKLLTA